MRPNQQQRDLSNLNGNPTSELQKNYDILMSINDADEFKEKALEIVEPLINHGLSQSNYQKFVKNLENSYRKGLTSLRFFITNYVLAGSGLRVESKESAIASLISEDIYEVKVLTESQKLLKKMVSKYGYNVALVTTE